MPRYQVHAMVAMRPHYEDRTVVLVAKNMDEAEAIAAAQIRQEDDDIDYIAELRSYKLDDN